LKICCEMLISLANQQKHFFSKLEKKVKINDVLIPLAISREINKTRSKCVLFCKIARSQNHSKTFKNVGSCSRFSNLRTLLLSCLFPCSEAWCHFGSQKVVQNPDFRVEFLCPLNLVSLKLSEKTCFSTKKLQIEPILDQADQEVSTGFQVVRFQFVMFLDE